MSDKKNDGAAAGSIRAGGGGFARMEVAHEEEYFYKQVSHFLDRSLFRNLQTMTSQYFQRQEQLHKLKEKSVGEAEFRKKAIADHEEAIIRHKEAIDLLDTKK